MCEKYNVPFNGEPSKTQGDTVRIEGRVAITYLTEGEDRIRQEQENNQSNQKTTHTRRKRLERSDVSEEISESPFSI